MDIEVERQRHVEALLAALPGAELRGSLAAGTADEFSDIDLLWPCGPAADERLAALPDSLAAVGTVESLRLDPDTAVAPARRLVFVRFAGWSLFARVDLELTGAFRTPSAPWATPWSAAESALMNVLAAVKATRRGRGDVDGLLSRGFERVGAPDPGGAPADRMRALVAAAQTVDTADLAPRVLSEIDRPR